MSETYAKMLWRKLTKNQPTLSIHCVALLENGIPLEYTTSLGRADRPTLFVNIVAKNAMLRRNKDMK